MKILLSGYHNSNYLTVTEYIERAIRSLGGELVVFDDRGHIIPGTLRRRLAWLQKFSLAVINRELMRLALRTNPDMILITGGHRITMGTLQKLRMRGFHIVLWTTDPPRFSDIMPTTAGLYHNVFCQGSEYVEIFERNGICNPRWLPMGCDPALCRVPLTSAKDWSRFGSDVVFVGSYYPWRAEALGALKEFDLGIWGPGWDCLPEESLLRPFLKGGHTPAEKWAKIYTSSKIVLSLHNSYVGEPWPVHQASPRVFEALACGAFVLTDFRRDVSALFEDGKHLVVFTDLQDMKEKVSFYLSHEGERRRIADAGRKEALTRHTYTHRLRQLLSLVGSEYLPHEDAFTSFLFRNQTMPSTATPQGQ